MRQFIIAVLAVLAMGLATTLPANADFSDGNTRTITEIALDRGGNPDLFDSNGQNHDILLKAVVTAGLADALNDPSSELTLFAPTDIAFVRLARDLGYSGFDEHGAWEFLVAALTDLGGGDPIPVLTDVLLYHVSPGITRSKQFFQTNTIPTLLGVDLHRVGWNLVDEATSLRNARVVADYDIPAVNGVIHSVNRVMIPLAL